MKKSVTQWSVRLHTYIAGGGGGRAAVQDAGDGISVICQIYEIRSWRFRQEIITAKRYIGEEWKIIGSFPRGYYCHLQCWYQSEWCRTYKWRKLWIVFQNKSSKENGFEIQLIILKICNILSFLLEKKKIEIKMGNTPFLDLPQFGRFFFGMRLAWPKLITEIYLGQSKQSEFSSKSSVRGGLVKIGEEKPYVLKSR